MRYLSRHRFCPSGWNTQNGSFAWNARAFLIRGMIDQLHKDNFRVVLHAVILSNRLQERSKSCEAVHLTSRGRLLLGCPRKNFAMESMAGGLMKAILWTSHHGCSGTKYWEGPQIDVPMTSLRSAS